MSDSVRYECPKCKHLNIWTRDELLQRGQRVIYRAEETNEEIIFSVRCKNRYCDERMRIALKK